MKLGTARVGLVVAAILLLLLEQYVPGGLIALYPFTLLATWVHEMGHGLMALLLGGGFDHLEINSDASGVAYTTAVAGWRSALVSAAGLLGPPLAGAAILAFARGPRRGAMALLGTAVALLISVVFWVRSVVGVLTMLPLALLLGALGLWGGRARLVLAQLLGLLFALDTLVRFDYLFSATATIGGAPHASDVVGIATGLFPPAILWGVGIAVLDLGLVAAGLWAAWRPERAGGFGERRGAAAGESGRTAEVRRAARKRERERG